MVSTPELVSQRGLQQPGDTSKWWVRGVEVLGHAVDLDQGLRPAHQEHGDGGERVHPHVDGVCSPHALGRSQLEGQSRCEATWQRIVSGPARNQVDSVAGGTETTDYAGHVRVAGARAGERLEAEVHDVHAAPCSQTAASARVSRTTIALEAVHRTDR